ncbi:hypothetical protein P154DRAFT_570051 [Amniculicola lignicola CBS 123094]|uniref:Protein kinase domain-containing protein n=1 Tax=Amniculicola lignicola CBS 123094 TaxID=1392246 RepID=A0A6A5X057_9PLEO|nr:hypothetical protein P154DRAFT_570051 [Amniculicola lignicola CBS 123094]
MEESARRNLSQTQLDKIDLKKQFVRELDLVPSALEVLWDDIPAEIKADAIRRERGPNLREEDLEFEDEEDGRILPRPGDIADTRVVAFNPNGLYPDDIFTIMWHELNGRLRVVNDTVTQAPPESALIGSLETLNFETTAPVTVSEEPHTGEQQASKEKEKAPLTLEEELPDHVSTDEEEAQANTPTFALIRWGQPQDVRYIRERCQGQQRPYPGAELTPKPKRWDFLKPDPAHSARALRNPDPEKISYYRFPDNYLTCHIGEGGWDYHRTTKYKLYTNWAAVALFHQLKEQRSWMRPLREELPEEKMAWCTITEEYCGANYWRVIAKHQWDDTVIGSFAFNEQNNQWEVAKKRLSKEGVKRITWVLYKARLISNFKIWAEKPLEEENEQGARNQPRKRFEKQAETKPSQWFELLDQDDLTTGRRRSLHVEDVLGYSPTGKWKHVTCFTDRPRFGYVALYKCVNDFGQVVDRVIFKHLSEPWKGAREARWHRQAWEAVSDYIIPLRGWSQRPADIKEGQMRLYIEYALFGSLDTLIRRYRNGNRQVPEVMVWRIFHNIVQACAGLQSQNLIHTDLKPQNVFMMDARDSYPAYPWPVLGDFGFMRKDGDIISTQEGTPGWQAPEVLRDPDQMEDHPIPWRHTHVYVAGLIAWAVMRGRKNGHKNYPPGGPGGEPFLPQDDPKIYSVRLERLVHACMHTNPIMRPPIQQLALDINKALEALESRIPNLSNRGKQDLPRWERVDAEDPFPPDPPEVDGRRRQRDDDGGDGGHGDGDDGDDHGRGDRGGKGPRKARKSRPKSKPKPKSRLRSGGGNVGVPERVTEEHAHAQSKQRQKRAIPEEADDDDSGGIGGDCGHDGDEVRAPGSPENYAAAGKRLKRNKAGREKE